MRGRSGRLLWLWMLPIAVLTLHAQSGADGPAPGATAAVLDLLSQCARVATAGDSGQALDCAERAAGAARQATDAPGEAQAHRARAQQLSRMGRSAEALAAWTEAEAAAHRAGDAIGALEATGWQAALTFPTNPERGTSLLTRVWSMANVETTRPRALVTALVDIGRGLMDRSLMTEAKQHYELAVQIGEKRLGESMEVAVALNGLGAVAYNRGDRPTARQLFLRVLAIRERLAPDSLALASILSNLGSLEAQGDRSIARTYDERALRIREKLAPDSLDMASSLQNLGTNALNEGRLATARDYYTRALALRERLAPNTIDHARSLVGLGDVALDGGDLEEAEKYFQQGLAIQQKLAPSSTAVASSFTNLGNVARAQGRLNVARDLYRRALSIYDQLAPESLYAATPLNSLGVVARLQGDLSAAREYLQRALAIREKNAPESGSVAQSLGSLGNVAREQGDFAAARAFFERGHAIQKKIKPESTSIASSLNNLGILAHHDGDMQAARDLYQRALTILETLAPGSTTAAAILANWGNLAADEGKGAEARGYHQRALAIRERLGPDSLDVADSLSALGGDAYRDGDIDAAIRNSARAWAIVRAQAGVVAGDEARQAFESQYRTIGVRLLRFQVAAGKTDEAFATLEEGRAQALLQLLAERGVARRLAPADLWRQYDAAQTAANRAGTALAAAGDREAAAQLALDAEVAQQSAADVVQDKRRVLAEQQQKASQARDAYTRARVEAERRWTEVRQTIQSATPAAAAASEIRSAIPPDTVLAAFVVGEEASTLFMVRRVGLVQTFDIPLPAQKLAARVKYVRDAVAGESAARGLASASMNDLRVTAAYQLFQVLFPADARQIVSASERLLLSPDDVLWELPFAALVTNDDPRRPQYLGLQKRLMYTQSLTAFAQTTNRNSRAPVAKLSVLAVGNPLFDNDRRGTAAVTTTAATRPTRADGELAVLSRNGDTPAPLPYAEREANAIAALYGARASTGPEPTEAWFRVRAPDADVIHLATHGYFNAFRSMSSGVRLAVPERDPANGETDNDGALQAWEVFTQLRLRADLVVLSACETGVGARVAGEGLIGLTRAFQAAGAASVIATKWRVADRSTERAMVALHRRLRQGLSKDEALRQAMAEVAADPTTAHPFHWASFVLIGDYRPLPAQDTGRTHR